VEKLGLTEYAASILVLSKPQSDYFEEALACGCSAKALCNWITVEFAGRLKESGKTLIDLGIPPEHVGLLVQMIEKGTITGKIAKSIADIMIEKPQKSPEKIVDENPDFKPMSDVAELGPIIDKVLAANEQSILDYKAGQEKAFNYLVGQIMKETRGKANPDIVKEELLKKLS